LAAPSVIPVLLVVWSLGRTGRQPCSAVQLWRLPRRPSQHRWFHGLWGPKTRAARSGMARQPNA